ncbi:hypothetical protein [Sphingomonas sp.]|uniref:hypothetical protein n=1 Tax=Sphingomonas sp. TaxID=28214 RepID=UPI003B0029A7
MRFGLPPRRPASHFGLTTVAAAALAVGGCTSSSSPSSPSAPQAWDRLRTQSQTSGAATAGLLVGGLAARSQGAVAGGGAMGVAHNLFEEEEKTANRECDNALSTPLPIKAVDAMVDDVAARMAKTLPEVPEVKNAPTQLVLAFESFDNGRVGDAAQVAQLSSAMNTLRTKLSKSEKMTNNFVFVSTTETDAAKLIEKIDGKDLSAFRDPLQRTPDTTHPVKYDSQTLFLITGSMTSTPDKPNHSTEMKMQLTFTHLRSRRVIDSQEFDRNFMWHPVKHAWEMQP